MLWYTYLFYDAAPAFVFILLRFPIFPDKPYVLSMAYPVAQ